LAQDKLLPAQLNVNFDFFFGFYRYASAYFARPLVPTPDGVIAGSDINNLERAARFGNRNIGMVRNDNPSCHPRMRVANDPDNFSWIDSLSDACAINGPRKNPVVF
jgi:hypothetical protein